ncbi:MAG TPA: hypothetical protein VNA57_05185 [Acidimicrobiales bacterium]|nr:hypothetical protein [Acidimicrobiales bacterium]
MDAYNSLLLGNAASGVRHPRRLTAYLVARELDEARVLVKSGAAAAPSEADRKVSVTEDGSH